MIGAFPFGQAIRKVTQTDRAPKRLFVLGVYASAVHARWVSVTNRPLVHALAVASEPYIFWRGEDADEIISAITIPEELGRLEPATPIYNGPSGIALDSLYLAPMGLSREDAWLCDLVPHSCANPGQKRAIEREYLPVASRYRLPAPSVPPLPSVLSDANRRSEIVSEIRESGAEILVLLGDQPIKWFLYPYTDQWRRLSDFGVTAEDYGVLHEVRLDSMNMRVLPLAHPRQTAKLGKSSSTWHELHQKWLNSKSCSIFG